MNSITIPYKNLELMVWAENHIYAEGGKLLVLVKINGWKAHNASLFK